MRPSPAADAARGVVAFRTHRWDDVIARLAARLFERRGDWDFVVLADETRAALDVAPYRKVSHTEDFGDLGLPRSGHPRELWYNSDYSFYRLLALEPRYDFFCISEYDVFAGGDLSGLFSAAAEEKLDLVTHRLGIAPADWGWTPDALAVYPLAYWSFNPFIVLSRKALEHLLTRRQAQANDRLEGRLPLWPYFETFVSAELFAGGQYKTAELGRFGRVDHFDWLPPFREKDWQSWGEGQMLIHPVHSDERYVSCLFESAERPQDYFDRHSALRQRLRGLPWPLVSSALRAALRRKKRYFGLLRLALFPERGQGPAA